MSGGVHAFNFNLNNLNNGVSRGVNSMPFKDATSDSAGGFATDRKAYANTFASVQSVQKKWMGGCRDASDVASRRRIAATGTSLNPDGGAFSFSSKTEKNTRIEALNRCRNQGNCVPPKVRNSPHHTNLLTPVWQPPNALRSDFVRTQHRAAVPLYYLGKSVNT
jgi:hypothetical protein